MNIAATASFNYATAPLPAGAAPLAAFGERAAIIAELVARLLQPAPNTPTATPSANSGAAIILTQLLGSLKSNSATGGAASMELNLNQLLNSAVLQTALKQLPPELLARPQVIEALVLQNTLLPATASGNREPPALPLLILPAPAKNAAAAAPAQTTGTLYRVSIEWQNRLIQLLSPQPLPTGTRVPLQIDPPSAANTRAAITLLPPAVAARLLLAQASAAATPAAGRPLAPAPATPAPLASLSAATARLASSSQPAALGPVTLSAAPESLLSMPKPALPTPVQTLQQSLRELLPRQQALHTLVPLLQKFIAPGVREQLPTPIFKAVAQLLQSLPKPAQLNTAEKVKQAINNSGSFLEARLAQAATAAPDAEPLPKIAATDIKAQISALLALVRHFTPAAGAHNTAHASAPFVAEEEFVYTKPAVQNQPGASTQTTASEPLDALLSQLGKLLQAGFARIQLHQLDSANARHAAPDTQMPVPTWVLELPLRTPHGVDQLQLRIEQHSAQQKQQHKRVQWNVEIAFDLHAAGKLAASLAIVDKSVSATLWAEREDTHRRVREEMAYLRAGLESVGVNVKEMQCRLGLPAPRSQPLSQQLVDVHT